MKREEEREGKGKGQVDMFNTSDPLKKMRWYALSVGVCWTILLFGLLSWDIYSTLRFTRELAIKEARANFNKDNAFRYWAASHGGVYVPIDENTPPNPYLKHIPERDISTPSGKKLTLMNPAYMVRQMNEFFSKEYGVAGHITSLKLHNPDNIPDDWEKKALKAFEKGKKEVIEFSGIKGKPYIRLMEPMMVVEGCLKCHAYQGYKVGDVRGGVSVSVPLSGLYVWKRKEIVNQSASHGFIWLLGLAGLFVGYGKTRKYLVERISTEDKLREAEDRARALLNATLESLILIDLEGNVLAINSTGASRLNATQEQLIGKNIFSFMSPEMVDSKRKLISEILSTHKSITFEDHRENRDFHTNLVPVQNGGVHAIAIFSQDITERKLADMAIRESEERFRQLAENIEEVFWLTDWKDNRVVYTSPSFETVWGKKRELLYRDSMEWTESIHPDDRKGVEDAFLNLVASGGFDIEYRIVQPGGSIRWIHDKGFPVKNDEGNVYRVAGIAHDITERKRVEEKLRQSEERLNRGQEVGHVGTWDWDPNTGKLLWSDETYRIHGFEPGEVEPSYELFLEMVHPDDRETLNKAVGRALVEKANYNIDCRIVRKDGIQRITNATGRVLFDDEGKPEHMLGTFQDITDRKQMEEALYFIAQKGWEASGEDFFETLVAYLANTLGVDYAFVGKMIDNKTVCTVALYANGKIEENIEYELRGTPCENVIGKELCCYPENIKKLFPEDEMLVPMEAEAYIGIPMWDSKGKSIGLIAVVSRRVISEVESAKALLQLVSIRAANEMERCIVDEELRNSEAMLKEAQELTHIGHWDLDFVSNELYWSDEIFSIFEVEKGKFKPSYDAFLDFIHPDDCEFVKGTYTESVKEKKPYDIIHRLLMKDGRVKHVNEKCRTEYDDNGKPLRSIGTVQDVTDIKKTEMELERAKEAAEAASLAKTDFLSRMSHELRTPLNSILGFAQVMQSAEDSISEKQQLCVEEITSAGWHLTDLVNEVLDISRVESGNLSLQVAPVDICLVMEECINLITPLAEERNINIITDLNVCVNQKALGDRTRLKEVFLNLLSNAVKYNIESGEVTISCDKRDDKMLLISIGDSGKGISREDQKLLFVPFSRIKGEDPAIQGTGIGLAISKRLVELMDGEIGVETARGKGSTFWVKLQIAEDGA
ncbi:MAG: PAS domain-containing protein [bacterium]|nr:PAS domain-containing protein [bacterium]